MISRKHVRDFVAICAVIVALCIGFLFGRSTVKKETEIVVVRERVDTVIVFDTIRLPAPEPVYVYIVRTDTVVPDDTGTATVPITQHTYMTDAYKAIVEGYKPKLLDLELYPQTVYVTNEKEVLRTVQVKRTWQPFISGSYSTFGITGVGGGTFYHNLGFEYQYQYSLRERMNGHQFSLKYKF